jgi:IS1 family transposase
MTRRPKPVHQMSVREFERMFHDEEACCAYLVRRRWPDGVHCPRCGAVNPHKLSNRPWSWQCYQCAPESSYRFSHIAGTIFENTNKPLRDWFRVVHLMLASKKGMSALQIMRYMGFGSYKTAWGMCHKVRTALMQDINKLGGIVEMDETFIGGKDKNRHWDKKKGHHDDKMPIIGAVQRKGNVVARVLERVTTQAALDFVNEVCSNKVSLLATDAWPGYQDLPAQIPHGSVDHSRHQYVIGAVHTNTIEGFWSIFKRGVVGTFHKMSAKYMPLYVAEFQFRYNNRENADIFGTAINGC